MKIYDLLAEFKKGIKAVKHTKKTKDPAKQFEKAKEKLAPVKPMEEGVAEGEGKTQKYEMMLRNGQVKKFIAKDDADAKRIAAGHGAKSVIRLRGGVPAGKVSEQGVAEGSLNEFAPDGFNGGDGDEFSPEIAKMAQEDGFTKGVSLADGATLERAITINHWHNQHGGMYKQYFAKGFIAGRKEKIRHDNKQYNLNLKLMKDGSIRHGEQGVAEGKTSIMGSLMNEGGWGRDSWDSNMPGWQRREQDAWDQSKRDFKRREMEHELGHEDDPDFERNFRQQQIDRDRGPWYLKVNGKILKSKGEVKVFDWKKGANNYALAILKNKPELQGKIFLTKKAEDDAAESIKETASPGATSAGAVATLGMNPKLSPGPARGKKSYTGSPGKSGTKAPPQPKVIQPKGKHGTAKNALDMKSNIFGGGAVKRK